MKKSNASRILDKLKIPHEILEYEADETDLSAENAAQKMGQPLKQVFKTLVIRGDKTGILAACIPGGAELNLKGAKVINRLYSRRSFAFSNEKKLSRLYR
jgi:Cys-tRNA(Pro)/Cys-tRNA(Cys) deacylase